MPHRSNPSAVQQPTLISKLGLSALLAMGVILVACNSSAVDNKQSTAADNASNVASSDSEASVVDALQANLQASGIEQKVVSAVPTSMPDIYWVTAEGIPAFFTDKEGKHIIQGQIIALGEKTPVDLTADLLADAAKTQLANVPLTDMVIYPAKGETKAVVYAFTDADCGYCRKLHSEMDDINSRGIEVRYLAWPRSEQSKPKMESIWCSEDRKAAMDAGKAGQPVVAPSCDSPVNEQVNLGLSLGVRGTPAIFTESGVQIGGYVPARDLAKAAIEN